MNQIIKYMRDYVMQPSRYYTITAKDTKNIDIWVEV